MTSFNLESLINTPTCFQSEKPLCIYLILTNKKSLFKNSKTFEVGISDHHHLVLTSMRNQYIQGNPKIKFYRDNKSFNFLFCFFFYLGFLSQPFTNHRTAGKGGGHFFNSSIPLPPASQTLRHQSDDYCRALNSAHRQQPDSNREPFVSEGKSLTIKLRAFSIMN